MEVKEIRIGNLIMDSQGDEVSIIGIKKDKNQLWKIKTWKGWEYLADCNPIPISEDVLFRLGFLNPDTDLSEGPLYWATIKTKSSHTYYYHALELYLDYNDDKFFARTTHSLQNLFFALMDEELSIKETAK